jgi:hypothetical protein
MALFLDQMRSVAVAGMPVYKPKRIDVWALFPTLEVLFLMGS